MWVFRPWFGLVLVSLALCASSCRRQAAQTPAKPEVAKVAPATPPPSGPAATSPATTTKVDKPAPADKAQPEAEAESDGPPPPKSWTEPRVLAELVKNCAFDPDSLPPAERKTWTGPQEEPGSDSVMSCDASMEQSCVYDPCYDEQGAKCNPRCVSKCKSCGQSCATKCETCKSPCQDDACKLGCAKKCADCHESCVRKRDRCATGTCTAEYKKCREKLRTEWVKNGCPALCAMYTGCKSACEEKNENAKKPKDCDKACPEPKGAQGCDMTLCRGGEGMGIDPESLD